MCTRSRRARPTRLLPFSFRNDAWPTRLGYNPQKKSGTRDARAKLQPPDAQEWWNDERLKALSARVVRAAPDNLIANQMRAMVLAGQCDRWEAGPRSAAELREAATHYEQAAALCPAPAMKAHFAGPAAWCRSQAGAM